MNPGLAKRSEIDSNLEALFERIRTSLAPSSLGDSTLEFLLCEYSCISRANVPFLEAAARATLTVRELHREITRNLMEERGDESGQSHYELFRTGLEEMGISVGRRRVFPATEKHVADMITFTEGATPSEVCGGFYTTEASAVLELRFTREVADQFRLRFLRTEPEPLARFYNYHLGGVEQGHREGMGRFIEAADLYGLDLQEITGGSARVMGILSTWWDQLIQGRPD